MSEKKYAFPADVAGCQRCGCRLPGELWHGPACQCEPLAADQSLVRLGAEKAMNGDVPGGVALIKEGYDLLATAGDAEGARHALIVAQSIIEVVG